MSHGRILKYLIESQELNRDEIAEKIGVSRQALYSYYPTMKFREDTLGKILEAFDMTEEEFNSYESISRDYFKRINNEINRQRDLLLEEESQKYSKSLPYYNVEVMASPMEVFNDQTKNPEYNLLVPGFEDCDFVCTVYGDSMYPKIKNGARIICKRMRGSIIDYGHIYFVVTEDLRVVKRIQKGKDKDHVILSSDNYHAKNENGKRIYEDYEIHKKEIIYLYRVKGWLNQDAV